jgi:hypothetical protein
VRQKDFQRLKDTARWKWTEWILSFGKIRLRELNRKELDRLKQDIIELCHLGPVSAFRSVSRLLPPVDYTEFQWTFRKRLDVTDSQLKKFHNAVAIALRQLFPPSGKDGTWQIPATLAKSQVDRRVIHETIRKRGGDQERVYSWISRTSSARWPDIFFERVSEMFLTFGSLVAGCSECQTLFLRTRRQTYCSRRCSQKARSNRWYKTHREQAKLARRDRYAQRIRKTYPHAKIQGRMHETNKR